MVRNFGSFGAFSFSYTYDELGRPTLATLPDSRSIRSTYDGSVLEKVEVSTHFNQRHGTWAWATVADNVAVEPSGAVKHMDYSAISGSVTYSYDLETHRLAMATGVANGSVSVQSLGLTYDLAGNLETANAELPTAADPTITETFNQTFTYDGLHRLRSAASTGALSYGVIGYGYDNAGNLRTKGDRTLLYEGSAAGAGPHAVTRVTQGGTTVASYAYDADGGLITRSKDGTTLSLPRDADGRLTGLSGAVGASYFYDETGERRRKTVSGGVDTLYVDPTYEVELTGANGPTHKIHVFHGGRRIATGEFSGTGLPTDIGTYLSWQYDYPDFVGSNSVVVRSATNPNDPTGPPLITTQASFFTPFGEFTQDGSGLSPYLFTDQEQDPESGLQYFGARYYDPYVGRFLSPDPELVGPAAGVTFGRIGADPQQSNAYSYVGNRPTVAVDPTGEAWIQPIDSGYTIHFTLGSLAAAGVTHVNGNPVDFGSKGGKGHRKGSGGKSAAEGATGASQGGALEAVTDAVGYAAKVEAVDTYAFVFANTIGKIWTLFSDIGDVLSAVSNHDWEKAGASLVSISVDLAFPNYGYYGGRHYGTPQFGTNRTPAPLNKQDESNFDHDLHYRHGDWVTNSWSQATPGLHTGIFGWGYTLIGTPFFELGAEFQKP